MTGAEKITERIINEAREKAKGILEEAEAKAAAMREERLAETEKERTAILEKARAEAAERKRRIRTVAQLDMRKELLGVKQELIHTAFERVLEQLQNLSVEAYQDTVYQLLMGLVRDGNEEIIIASGDEGRWNDAFLNRINQGLQEKGIPGQVRLSEERRNLRGGFVLKSRNMEINSSFESILRTVRDEMEPQVAQVLFGD